MWRKQTLYKFVDVEAASAVASGSLKIGTLRSYAQLESERADSLENTVRKFQSTPISGDTAEGRKAAKLLGIGIEEDCRDITVVGNVTQTTGPNRYCFCTSLSAGEEAEFSERAQAVFAIKDPDGFAQQLANSLKRCGLIHAGPVTYASRSHDISNGIAVHPNPFSKPVRFRAEQEVRFVFEHQIPDHAASHFSPPDGAIARFLERVR